MGDDLLFSIVASLVLTIVLNVVLRFWKPDPERWFPSELVDREPVPPTADGDHGGGGDRSDGSTPPRVRVFFPWKAMLALSIGLTVLLNILALIRR